MASTWYIVATGNINSSTPFATTSGGAGGAGTPTTGDTIIGDGNSGSAVLTINAAISLASFDMNPGVNGPFAGTITHNAFGITISAAGAGAFRLSSGMTYTPSGVTALVTFTNTSGTANLTSAGKSFGAITINGAGGTVQQQDNLSVSSGSFTNATLTLTTGTLDSQSFSLTACLFTFGTGSATRVYTSTGTITLGGNVANSAALIGSASGTGFTPPGTWPNITILAPSAQVFNFTFTPPPSMTFSNITINNNTRNCSIYFGATAFTCGTLTIGSGYYIQAGATVTCSSFALNGAAANPSFYGGNAIASAVTLSCSGTATATWASIYNCTGTVGTFTATNSFALGQTTGWSITPPSTLTAATIATTIWQDLLSSSDFSTASSIGALLKAASNLQYSVPAITRVTIGSSSSTTSINTSACTPAGAAANQFSNRTLLFDANTTTTALQGQARAISASSNAAAPVLTVTALTTAPVSGDTASIV